MGFVSNYQTENNFNFNKGARGKKNILSLIASVVVAFAFVVGAIVGIVNLNATNSGAGTIGESFPSIEASGVSDGTLKNLAVVDQSSLVIWTKADSGPDEKTVQVSGNATGTETYYSNSNLTSYIKDMRTPVKYNGSVNKYYLTSQVRTLTITYQMGSGIQNDKPCIFVMKFTLDVCAMDEAQTKTSFTYQINSMTVEYLALHLNGTGASATPFANYGGDGSIGQGDTGYLYYTETKTHSSVKDEVEAFHWGDKIYEVSVDETKESGTETYWGRIKAGEKTEITNYAVKSSYKSSYLDDTFVLLFNNKPENDSTSDLCLTFDGANVVGGDSKLTSASGSGDDVAVGPNVYAYSLKSNIWIRADFETVKHQDNFYGHVIYTNDDLTPNSSAGSGVGTGTVSSDAINGMIDSSYDLNAAGDVIVNYFEQGKTYAASIGDMNTDIFKDISSSNDDLENASFNETAETQSELGSTDVMSITVTPNNGYYISDIIVNYNGQDHYVVWDGKIEASNGSTVYTASGSSGVVAGSGKLNFVCHNTAGTIVNPSNGECTLFLSGFMKDVSVHVVYKSEVFLWVEIDNIVGGHFYANNDLDGEIDLEKSYVMAGFDRSYIDSYSKAGLIDSSSNRSSLFTQLVEEIYIDGDNSNSVYDLAEDTVEYYEKFYDNNGNGEAEVGDYFLVYLIIRLPGSSSIDVRFVNERNKTLAVDGFVDKNNKSLGGAGIVEYEKTVTDGKLVQTGNTEGKDISTGVVNVSPNYDQFVYNPLYVADGFDYTTMKVSTVNHRMLDFNSYVETGDVTEKFDVTGDGNINSDDDFSTKTYAGKNYRIDKGTNTTNSLYLFNTTASTNGVWGDAVVSYHNNMNGNAGGAATSKTINYGRHYNGNFDAHFFDNTIYGNQFSVVMNKVDDGYYNRRIQLIATDAGHNPLNATDGSVIEINFNEADIKSVTEAPDDWSELSIEYRNNLSYVIRYKAFMDGNNLKVIFNLNDLMANNFQLNTYYDVNEYNVDYHNNGVTDTVVNSVTAWHNVKHTVDVSEVFDNAYDDRTGYTLLGYVQNEKPVYNADGNDLIYYTSKSDVYFPLTLEYYDRVAQSHEYLKSYNENPYRERFSLTGTDDYDWLFGSASYAGYTFYSYNDSDYTIHKNLDQDFLGASSYEIYSYKNHDDDESSSYTCNMYAVWSANTYNVHYNVNKENALNDGGGSSDISIVDTGIEVDFIQDNYLYYNGLYSDYMYITSMNFDHKFKTNTFNETSSTFKFPTLSRTGYIFVGWSVKDFDLEYNDNDLDYTKALNNAGEYEEDWTKYLVTPDDVYNLQLRAWNKVSDGSNAYTDPSSDNYKRKPSPYIYHGGPNITLYAIWKPIIYSMSTDCMQSIFYDIGGKDEGSNFKSAMENYLNYYYDYNTGSATYVSYYFDLNDKHQNNGSSEAIIYGNNQYKVQFDGKLTNLYDATGYRTIYPTRVGYDFNGWRASVTGEGADAVYGDVIDENTVLNYTTISTLASRENPSHAGYWDGVETGSYYDTTDPDALKTGGHENAWINLIPTWEAQDFTVYYSLANHTLRGYTSNHVDEAKGIVDDITFKLDDIDFNFEGMYEDTAHDNKLTYYTKTFKFDTVIPIPYFASTDYGLAGWYYWYDGASEPHVEGVFDDLVGDDSARDYVEVFDYDLFVSSPYWANYKNASGDWSEDSYAEITKIYDLSASVYPESSKDTKGDGSVYYYQSSDLNKQNKKVVQATDDDVSLENRKFTLFSHLTPKGNFIQTSAKKTNPDDVLSSTDEQMEDYYLETPNFTGNGNFSVKEYEYNTENEFVYKHTLPLTAGTLPNRQTRALEDDYIIEILPTTSGLYLSTLQILFGDTHIWVYFNWNSALKELRIGQVNYKIDGVNYGINSEINKTNNSEKDKATYSYQTGQAMNEWDNLIVSIGKAGMYTYDVNGVITDSALNDYRNEFTASDGTVHNDCIPVYISIDFLKNAANDNIVIESTWAWQTYDVGVFMLNAEADDGGKNYQSGSKYPEEDVYDYYNMTYGLYSDILNPIKFMTGFITVPYGYQLISNPEYNYYYKLPLYEYVEGSSEVVVNGKPYSTVGDTIALNEDGTVVYQSFRYFYMTQTLSTYYVLETDGDGNIVYEGSHPKKATNPLWSQDYIAGYRFLDYYELFNGYSENEFIYQSGNDKNLVFFPSAGYKFLGAYYDDTPSDDSVIRPTRIGADEKSLVTSRYYELEHGFENENRDKMLRKFNTRSIGSYNAIESYFIDKTEDSLYLDGLYVDSLLDRAGDHRWQTIYENTNFYKLYVKEKEQEVVFHIYNKETKRYEAVNTGETYRFGYTLMDNNGNYVDELGNIVDYNNRVYIQNSTSDYIDVENGIVKIVPSPNSGSWPKGTGFNGFVVGPNLKTLYGYDPVDGQYLYNTDYVGKFFTTSFVDLINYHGDKYNDSNMFDAYGWEAFNDEYPVDHLIHVYAIYDYQEFNIETRVDNYSNTDSDYIVTESGGYTIGNSDLADYKRRIQSGDTAGFYIDININLTWTRMNQDGTPLYTYSGNELQFKILDELQYYWYLYRLDCGDTRESALAYASNTARSIVTNTKEYMYIIPYIQYSNLDARIYWVADNMVKYAIKTDESPMQLVDMTIESTYNGIRFKDYVSESNFTLDLGAYTESEGMVYHSPATLNKIWLTATEFKNFTEYYSNVGNMALIKALNKANGGLGNDTKGSDDEFLFLYLSRGGNPILATTNFVRIKTDYNGETPIVNSFIYDTTDFFDISSISTSTGNETYIDVDDTAAEDIKYINYNISFAMFDYNNQTWIHLTYENVAYVMLDEIAFAYYQNLMDNGDTAAVAIKKAWVYQQNSSVGKKVYIIPCLTNGTQVDGSVSIDADTEIYAVSETILKYTENYLFKINNSAGFKVVASRIFDDVTDINKEYYYSNDDCVDKLGNMYLNYHINCLPGSNKGGHYIFYQYQYDKYVQLINEGYTIEGAVASAKDVTEPGEYTDNGMRYIFVYRSYKYTVGEDEYEEIIVSSSIITYNVRRGLTSIKTANNHFDISAMFAKKANYYVTNESYDYAFNILWSADESKYKIDSGIIAGGGHREGGFDIYYTLSLGYGYNGGAYTPSDIQYLALNEKQYALYSALMNSLEYYEINTTLRGIMLKEVYNALKNGVEYSGLTSQARTTITMNEYNLYRAAIAGTLYEDLDSELKALVDETVYGKMCEGKGYDELSDTDKLRISETQYNLFLALRSGTTEFDDLDVSIKGILSEETYAEMSSYKGQEKYNVINYVISYAPIQGIETANVYVFAYLDHTGTSLTANTVFASHIINLNTDLGYAILI